MYFFLPRQEVVDCLSVTLTNAESDSVTRRAGSLFSGYDSLVRANERRSVDKLSQVIY